MRVQAGAGLHGTRAAGGRPSGQRQRSWRTLDERWMLAVGLFALASLGCAGGQKAAEGPATELGSLAAVVPADWKAQPAGGQFRLAQFVVPRAEGDTAPALFIAFHFGKGGGGTVEDNLKRWKGMMRQPEGTDVQKVAKVQKFERDGLRITTIDLPGTYLERPFPMAEEVTPRPNYRLLAAIVETTKDGGDGPYYFRLVGPAKSVGAAKAGWDALIASVKFR